MATKLGINGFGRIGRYLVRLVEDCPDLEIAIINARAENADLAHLLTYDSVHGKFPGEVSYDEKGLIVNGKSIPVTRKGIGEWEWGSYGVDIAVETTGKVKDRDGLAQHIACGAKKAVNSAPAKNADVTIVMGVNHKEYNASAHQVISAASCTTNCLAPATKVINDKFGIKSALMTTIHAYTMSQRILDGSDKDLRRGRAAAMSLIPTSTGAARAIGLVIPELKGKIDGMAVRVPTPDGSMVDVVYELKSETTAEEVNAALKAAAAGPMKGSLGYTEVPLVSIDYIGDTHGGVVDALCTNVIDGNLLKLIIWYDNEAGFTNQLVRLLVMVGKSL